MAGRWSLKPLVVLVACSAAACGQAESARESDRSPGSARTFAGALNGTDAMVAAVESGTDWVFYICGGPTTQATLTRWLEARLDPKDGSSLEATDQNATLVATRGTDSISGTLVDPSGSAFSFEAARIDAPPGKAAGLYAALDSGCRTGLVVVPSATREPSRVQGVWCDANGRVGQVTPIEPIALDQRGLAVLVGPDERLLHLLPAIPPL